MRRLHYNQNCGPIVFLLVVAFGLVAGLTTHLADADDKPYDTKTYNNEKKQKIHITADKLVSDNKANYAEFIGNVRANQGETTITSDRLKIFYKKDLDNQETPSVGEESIKKIVANGNVRIKFDNKVAITQQAVYNTATRVIVLSGADSKILSGNDYISGEKITLYRTDGRINVESGNEKRVEAVFYGAEKVIN